MCNIGMTLDTHIYYIHIYIWYVYIYTWRYIPYLHPIYIPYWYIYIYTIYIYIYRGIYYPYQGMIYMALCLRAVYYTTVHCTSFTVSHTSTVLFKEAPWLFFRRWHFPTSNFHTSGSKLRPMRSSWTACPSLQWRASRRCMGWEC